MEIGIQLLAFAAAAGLFAAVSLLAAALLRERRSQEKAGGLSSTYECGMPPVGDSWIQFNVRYYLIALLFVIFDVEAIFLFPWAVVFRELGVIAFLEMGVFLGVLILGLAYAWRKGALEWA